MSYIYIYIHKKNLIIYKIKTQKKMEAIKNNCMY